MATKTSRPDGTVRLSDVKVADGYYLHPDYEIQLHDPIRGDTGLLKVFSLVPIDGKGPVFKARIDDGGPASRKTPVLDIDIQGVSKKVERDFKKERNGYSGHHTDKSKNEAERIFKVEIIIPTGTIFKGEVSLKAQFVMAAQVGTFSISHVRKTAE